MSFKVSVEELPEARTASWNTNMEREYTRMFKVIFYNDTPASPPPSGAPMRSSGGPVTVSRLGSPYKACKAFDSSYVDAAAASLANKAIPARGERHDEDLDAVVHAIGASPRKDHVSGYNVTIHYKVPEQYLPAYSRDPMGDSGEVGGTNNPAGDNPMKLPPVIQRGTYPIILPREYGQAVTNVDYGSPPNPTSPGIPDPLGIPTILFNAEPDHNKFLKPFKRSISGSSGEEDWPNGDDTAIGLSPMLNSCGDPFESLPEIETHFQWISITRYERNVTPGYISQWLGMVNIDTFDDGPPGTACIVSIEPKRFWTPRTGYYHQITYMIRFDPRGWNVKLVDAGLNYIEKVSAVRNLHPIKDAEGNNVVRARALDGNGNVLPLHPLGDNGQADPTKLTPHVYRAWAVRGRRTFARNTFFTTAPGSDIDGHGPPGALGPSLENTYLINF